MIDWVKQTQMFVQSQPLQALRSLLANEVPRHFLPTMHDFITDIIDGVQSRGWDNLYETRDSDNCISLDGLPGTVVSESQLISVSAGRTDFRVSHATALPPSAHVDYHRTTGQRSKRSLIRREMWTRARRNSNFPEAINVSDCGSRTRLRLISSGWQITLHIRVFAVPALRAARPWIFVVWLDPVVQVLTRDPRYSREKPRDIWNYKAVSTNTARKLIARADVVVAQSPSRDWKWDWRRVIKVWISIGDHRRRYSCSSPLPR